MDTPTTGALARALADFQAEAPSVPKGKTATVPMKSGGKYSYDYADLADVAAAAYPILSRHGLSFACCPRQTDRGYELRGILMHESGEQIEGSLPIPGGTPQELGSSITYARRYLLGSMTGIVTDADDDGAAASKAKPEQRPRQTQRAAASEPPADSGELMTTKTRGQMFALFSEHHIAEDAQKAGIAKIIGHPIESRADLTEAQAQAVIAALRARPKPQPSVEPDGPMIPNGDRE